LKTKIDAAVKFYQGKPAIHLNGEPVTPMLYALTDKPTGNRSFEGISGYNTGLFAEMGFRLFQFDVNFNDMLFPGDKLDITFAKKQIRGAMDLRSDCAVMLRLHVNPPFWWINAHPETLTRFADAETVPLPDYLPKFRGYIEDDLKPRASCSYASELWYDYMSRQVERFLCELEKTPEGGRVFAIQIANGVYGENHYWAFLHHDPDISEPMRKRFAKFLTEKYGGDFSSVQVPGIERNTVSCGIFRDPKKERLVSDYYECQHKTVTDSILGFAKLIKNNWPRKILTGAFYGYYISVFGRAAAGGHLMEQELLTSPDIDFLCAPGAYNKSCREPGGPGLSRGLIESVTAHGKLWLDEMDQPTADGTVLGGMYVFDKPTSIQNNRKCVMQSILRGAGLWYYDFGYLFSAGWWEEPEYRTDIVKLKALADRQFHQPHTAPADVLLVFDTKVFLQTATSSKNDPITDEISVNITPVAAYKSGAAVETCYLSDLFYMPLDKYKAIVFCNCFYMTERQRRKVRETAGKNGRNLIWLTAPACTDGERLSVDFVSEITGIQISEHSCVLLPEITLDHTIGGTLGGLIPGVKFNPNSPEQKSPEITQTLFSPDDPDAVCLGKYNADGTCAAAKKEQKDHTDWFFALPPTEPSQLRKLFAACGCHIYNGNDDATLAGAGLIMIQSRDGGEREIILKNKKPVKFTLEPSQTVFLDERTGEILL